MKIRIIDIVYYKFNPKALFKEALGFLNLSLSDTYAYAAAQNNMDRWLVLMQATMQRFNESEESRERHLMLFKHLTTLGWLKGWL